MTAKTLDQLIEITPGVVGGKPRIAGHRITVQNIAIWHERLGRGADEIASEYDLSLEEIYAALAYYFTPGGDRSFYFRKRRFRCGDESENTL